MTFVEKFGVAGAVCVLALVLAAFGGWIANIVKLFGMLGGDINAMLIGRSVGIIFAPLGAVLGYL